MSRNTLTSRKKTTASAKALKRVDALYGSLQADHGVLDAKCAIGGMKGKSERDLYIAVETALESVIAENTTAFAGIHDSYGLRARRKTAKPA